jgi:RimJ/RimL family protein N-acetyltransferase
VDRVRIETERLVLEPAGLAWRGDMLAMFNEPEVADWLFLTGPPTLEQLTRRIDIHEAFWREFGYGMFAVIEKKSGRFVARVGPIPSIGAGAVEVAWSTVREAWGLGYAVEATKAAIDFTFGHSALDSLDCYLRPDNAPSRRVAEKLGFRYQDTRYLYDRVLRFYRLDRPAS